ncbi:MAG TPA: hypothetical protein VHM29_12090 [Acidimicrobiia bacterium]|nr:hypothetical protein [Acidimicrobiia bacterium]
MAGRSEGIGCRDAALSTIFLLAFGIVCFATGLTMINRDVCEGVCETVGLTLLYAGGPVSALIGIFSDSVIVAWPLDVIVWVVLGFAVARLATNRRIPPWGPLVALLVFFLIYGLVLSQLVELTV